MIASMVLLVALGTFLGSLVSGMSTSTYTQTRNESLDDLRLTAAAFTKDARQAVRVTVAQASTVTMQTYVDGALKTVTWQVVTEDGVKNLRRSEDGGNPRLYDVHLTSSNVFSYYYEVDPARVNRMRLVLATQPLAKYPPVEIEADAEMRNVG